MTITYMDTYEVGMMLYGYGFLFLLCLAVCLFGIYGRRYTQYWESRRMERMMETHMRRRQQRMYKAARNVYDRHTNGAR
jgi:hypothetical protein